MGIRLMRRAFPVAIAIALLAAWGYLQHTYGEPAAPSTRPARAAPTSRGGGGELLLEDDDASADGKPLADNSRCHVCHVNFQQEELSLKHAKAGVGCAKCHGASDAHIADESWASGGNGTAPEMMYPADKINPACLSCHKDKLDREKHKDFLAGNTKQKLCTECHGKHKMAVRKCKWK